MAEAAPEAPRRKRAPRLSVPLLAAASLIVMVGGTGACGEQDGGSDRFPGTVIYDSPDATYHFHYLSPPWIAVKLPGVSSPVFMVPPVDLSAGITPTEADAPYSMRVEAVGMSFDQAIAASAGAVAPPVPAERIFDVLAPDHSRIGREMSWQEGTTVFRREADLAGAQAGACFRMRFTAKSDMSGNAMIAQMMASFQPRPSSAVGTQP